MSAAKRSRVDRMDPVSDSRKLIIGLTKVLLFKICDFMELADVGTYYFVSHAAADLVQEYLKQARLLFIHNTTHAGFVTMCRRLEALEFPRASKHDLSSRFLPVVLSQNRSSFKKLENYCSRDRYFPICAWAALLQCPQLETLQLSEYLFSNCDPDMFIRLFIDYCKRYKTLTRLEMPTSFFEESLLDQLFWEALVSLPLKHFVLESCLIPTRLQSLFVNVWQRSLTYLSGTIASYALLSELPALETADISFDGEQDRLYQGVRDSIRNPYILTLPNLRSASFCFGDELLDGAHPLTYFRLRAHRLQTFVCGNRDIDCVPLLESVLAHSHHEITTVQFINCKTCQVGDDVRAFQRTTAFSDMPHLRKLEMDEIILEANSLHMITRAAQNLNTLKCNIDGSIQDAIMVLQSLPKLAIFHIQTMVASLNQKKSCRNTTITTPHLQELHLTHFDYAADLLHALNAPNMHSLFLQCCRGIKTVATQTTADDVTLSSRRFPGLRRLELAFSDTFISEDMRELSSVTRLAFSHIDNLDFTFMAWLSGNATNCITHLRIQDCKQLMKIPNTRLVVDFIRSCPYLIEMSIPSSWCEDSPDFLSTVQRYVPNADCIIKTSSRM